MLTLKEIIEKIKTSHVTALLELLVIWIPETPEEKAIAKKLLYKLAEQYIKGEINF